MATRNLLTMLAYEASRRPNIAALLERAHLLTDEEIDNAVVPLKWYRDALRLAREKAMFTNDTVVLEANRPSINDEVGEIREYTGPTTFVRFTHGSFEVQTGDFYFFIKGHVWVDHLFSENVPHQLSTYRKVSDARRGDYVIERRKQVNQRNGHTEAQPAPDRYVTDSEGNRIKQIRITSDSFR